MVGRRRPAFSEYRPKPVLLPESFCVPLRRRMCGLSRFHRPMICDCCVGNICPLPAVYHPPASFVKKHFPLRKRFHHRKFYTFTVTFFPLRMVQCLQTDTEKEYLFLTNNSGYTTRETLNTYAYRPSIVLDGVGDIPALARNEKR